MSQTSVDLFDRRYKVATEEIAMLTTAGKLTVMTESGSGTLAGGAQADGFADWAAGESSSHRHRADGPAGQPGARRVPPRPACTWWNSRSRAWTRPRPDKEIANAAALRAAGYDIDDAEVSERTGWQVTAGVSSSQLYAIKAAGYVPQQQTMEGVVKMPLQPAPQETPYTLNSRRRDALTTLLCTAAPRSGSRPAAGWRRWSPTVSGTSTSAWSGSRWSCCPSPRRSRPSWP